MSNCAFMRLLIAIYFNEYAKILMHDISIYMALWPLIIQTKSHYKYYQKSPLGQKFSKRIEHLFERINKSIQRTSRAQR